MVTAADVEEGNVGAVVPVCLPASEPRPQTDEVPDGLHERQLVQECKRSEQYDGSGPVQKCRLQFTYDRGAARRGFNLLAGVAQEGQGESYSQQNLLLIRRQVHEHTVTFVMIV